MGKKELYLLRHAAASEGVSMQSDLDRKLTIEGVHQLVLLSKN